MKTKKVKVAFASKNELTRHWADEMLETLEHIPNVHFNLDALKKFLGVDISNSDAKKLLTGFKTNGYDVYQQSPKLWVIGSIQVSHEAGIVVDGRENAGIPKGKCIIHLFDANHKIKEKTS